VLPLTRETHPGRPGSAPAKKSVGSAGLVATNAGTTWSSRRSGPNMESISARCCVLATGWAHVWPYHGCPGYPKRSIREIRCGRAHASTGSTATSAGGCGA